MPNSSRWFLIIWLIILTVGIIVVEVFTSRRLLLFENTLRTEINGIREEIQNLKKQNEESKKETFEELEGIPIDDFREISEVDISNWETYVDKKFGYEIKYPSDKLRVEEKIGYDGRKYTAFYSSFENRLRTRYSPYPFPEGIAIRVEIPGIWATPRPKRLLKARNLTELEDELRKVEKPFRIEIERVIGDYINGLKINRSTTKYFAWDIYVLKGETFIMVISVVSDSPQIPPLFKQMIRSIKFINES